MCLKRINLLIYIRKIKNARQKCFEFSKTTTADRNKQPFADFGFCNVISK